MAIKFQLHFYCFGQLSNILNTNWQSQYFAQVDEIFTHIEVVKISDLCALDKFHLELKFQGNWGVRWIQVPCLLKQNQSL